MEHSPSISKTDVLNFLALAYEKTLSAGQLKAYLNGLNDIDGETLDRAADEWMKNQKWFPRISELRELCRSNGKASSADQLISKLNEEYDAALDGNFDAEVWMRLLLQLRVSDRQEQADSWRKRYDIFRGDVVVDRKKYATDWGSAA